MLTNQAYALNMPLHVSAIIVRLTDTVRVSVAGFDVAHDIDIASDGAGCPYTITETGGETFDDLNDAIAYTSRGDNNTCAAYIITPNINYPSDQFDLVIYSRAPIHHEHFHGA